MAYTHFWVAAGLGRRPKLTYLSHSLPVSREETHLCKELPPLVVGFAKGCGMQRHSIQERCMRQMPLKECSELPLSRASTWNLSTEVLRTNQAYQFNATALGSLAPPFYSATSDNTSANALQIGLTRFDYVGYDYDGSHCQKFVSIAPCACNLLCIYTYLCISSI